MRLPRLYIDHPLAVGAEVSLPKEVAHYVQQVLRLRRGAAVVLFNGLGGEYRGILRQNNKQMSVIIEESFERSVESSLHIHLGQGISRGEKMDYVVQKAVELGVSEITPLFTERCGVKLIEERAQKRLEHWQKIIHSACEQSGRNRVPRINSPIVLAEWLVQRTEPFRLICHPGLAIKNADTPKPSSIALLIGAEGGFTEGEVSEAMTNQFQPFTLGPRILRTETATVAALTKLQVSWGDI
jgi:16S rRNA (uracil1498-N3)-methyltransferase